MIYLERIIFFVQSFDAWYFFYSTRSILFYLFGVFFCTYTIMDYLGSIFALKKSDKKIKYIRKEYNIFQRILLQHWYQNIYKKVDRFWFNLIYKWYLLHLALFLSVIVFSLLSHYWKVCNTVDGILFVVHCVFMCITIIIHFLNTKISPNGGRELRCMKKYQRKNW